ncbi:hypothetical protein E8E13_006329 [Curvularia kusanoi]|uniref:Methyltransferase type 12 domain-containing protein n=1 Tax=Curvularia kusanoi TaxID=90978 RepID=A0A9P4T8T9_CURKU|nr:hypothetical protein E8E13_006329 [Curvularia kusanoi]
MTKPSVNTTFDASLVDLHPNASFSTTESDPSDAGMSSTTRQFPTSAPTLTAQDQSQTTPAKSPKSIQHIGTQDAYDQWASVYDTDGNMLQSIDDDELNTLLPSLLDQTASSPDTCISVLDLGCGTGRNTARLITHTWPASKRISVTGLDFSEGMLSLARTKLTSLIPAQSVSLRLDQCNPFPTSGALFNPEKLDIPPQDLVLSTLVLEHIPLPTFMATLSSLLAPSGGTALVTNMHADMGAMSQAGFVNAAGVKVRGESYVYTLAQTVQAAQDVGLEVVAARERKVEEEDIEKGVVGERGRKWKGVKVWFGVVVRKA